MYLSASNILLHDDLSYHDSVWRGFCWYQWINICRCCQSSVVSWWNRQLSLFLPTLTSFACGITCDARRWTLHPYRSTPPPLTSLEPGATSSMATPTFCFTQRGCNSSRGILVANQMWSLPIKIDVKCLLPFSARYNIRGIRHLVFYSLPTYCEFYPQLVNMLEEGVGQVGGATCTVVYSTYDALALCRIVGTSRAGRMVNSTENIQTIITGSWQKAYYHHWHSWQVASITLLSPYVPSIIENNVVKTKLVILYSHMAT